MTDFYFDSRPIKGSAEVDEFILSRMQRPPQAANDRLPERR